MRALFTKELLQGRPLLLFAGIMALLVPLCSLVFARAAFLYMSGYDTRWLPVIFGFVVLGLPLPLAVFSSAGLFSGEAHRGTLPVLFALPLSRGRIWLAKVLAALTLTVLGSLLVLIIGGALLPGPYRDLPISDHLLELACCIVFLLSVGAFCSSLSRNINAALPTTLILAGAIIAGAFALRLYYGAPLVGPPWLDIALWCCFTSPALLLGSALVVIRGELLQSARKWLFGVPSALLVVCFTLPLVAAVTRTTTRYARPEVQGISQVSLPDGGSAASLLAHADAVKLFPQWLVNLVFDEEGLYGRGLKPGDLPLAYRTNHAIVLDLTSGGELFQTQVPLEMMQPDTSCHAACSTDGRLAAYITSPPGLTWGIRQNRPLRLQILDLEQDKVPYSGWPEEIDQSVRYLSWSPSGNYLVLSSGVHDSRDGAQRTMYFLDRDGSQTRSGPLTLRSPGWHPNEDVIYGFDGNDNLRRAYPDDRTSEVIWSPEPAADGVERQLFPQQLSPDGIWFAVLEYTEREAAEPGAAAAQRTEMLRLVPTDGGSARLVWQDDGRSGGIRDITWSGDAQALFFTHHTRGDGFYTIQRWSRKTGGITRLGPEIASGQSGRFLTPPGADQVVFWGIRYDWPDRRSRGTLLQLVGGMLALADGSGGWRSLPSAEESSRFATEHEPIGFDSRGRLILIGRKEDYLSAGGPLYSRLEALDLDTGRTETIYP